MTKKEDKMSIIPDWMVNAGDCISEVVDDGLDLAKGVSQNILDVADNTKEFMRDNTWSVVHYPVNAAISAATLPQYLHKEGVEIVDDYLFENEKREISHVEKQFVNQSLQNQNDEQKHINQLQQEADAYAEQEIQRLINEQFQKQNAPSANATLKASGQAVQEEVVSVPVQQTSLYM